MTLARWMVSVGLVALTACGGSTVNGSARDGGSAGAPAAGGSAGAPGAGGSAGTPGAGGSAGAPGAGGSAGVGDDCERITASLAAATHQGFAASVVVRLDYQSLAVRGHAIVAGDYAPSDEASARERAREDTGYGDGRLLTPSSPGDEWVFYSEPGDFGGAAAVSARTGQTVFGGSIIWMGRGETNYPARWETSALGHDCEKVPDRPARGFDLRDGSPLGQAEVDAALEVVWRTAVPAALYQWGYVFDSVVLLYPRTVGAFDPTSAEYVVIVNSGFLE